ncbi:hypothetical protein A2634_01025 [Candidatus Amesbacteria bacterium RIFCSPHIGHO2_01_FULL_48_32]|uniref:Peptidase M50 domain-containing protein n=1 Tax=Candidatus Amesbacteria bacterium RIFCSPLOWO2_01_FULL_48_25 TaxID=1797259 RepID=A0A1F4ZBH8_9BACT|nr:MAG: hypothetical protein A2634_01025 [Candidatus Amesbacteria bacterium RIFCSPHIGHO2_01_FULL_48_32]OGD03622.1 MAG: hypothetical protein A2989_03005 [Candidatus Amesbacteria bacterium RIFCSPLOWO2_01_FULL_48_25]HJZ06031.1 site-2 protease family protein [Patescibacteria group bacterium]
MLPLLFSNPYAFILFFGGLIIAIGIHEAAHCYMADYLGDPTPRALGRLTLNPLAHLDPLGTVVILITGAFGWGKPSPFDPYNLKDPRKDTAKIALAGPVSNIIVAILLAQLFRFPSLPPSLNTILYSLVSLNINLALFNLIPLPPLDGSKIFAIRSPLLTNPQTSYFILILLIATGIIGSILFPISNFLLHILL